MKIVILNGSPRVQNTAALCKAFTEGAESKGHEVTEFRVAKMKISPCSGCGYCKGRGEGRCAIMDEWSDVRRELEGADMVVFATPIYYFAPTPQLERAISRLYACDMDIVKKAALIMSSASPDVYTASIAQYKDMLKWFGAEDLGIFAYRGDIAEGDKACAEMKAFGVSI